MDEELAGKDFQRFMRRRGLAPADEEEQMLASAQPPLSHQASSSNAAFPLLPVPLHLQPPSSANPLPRAPARSNLHRLSQVRAMSSFSNESTTSTPPGSADQHARLRRTRTPRPLRARPSVTQPPRTRRRRNDTDDSARIYKCEYCTLSFGRKHHKERHVANIHRNEKPYVCAICGHPFHQKPNLDRHRATVHSELSPFQCEYCGLSFSRRSVLKTHLVTVHQRHKRYQCPLCRKFFAHASHLEEHMRTIHPHVPRPSPMPPMRSRGRGRGRGKGRGTGNAFPDR